MEILDGVGWIIEEAVARADSAMNWRWLVSDVRVTRAWRAQGRKWRRKRIDNKWMRRLHESAVIR